MRTLDRAYTHPLINSTTGDYNNPSSYEMRSTRGPSARGYARTVRDVAWHPTRPEMLSTAWCEGEIDGSIAKHEWFCRQGETLEDATEREALEAKG